MIDCKVGAEDRVEDLEDMARTLEASGTYRVLRRLAPHNAVDPPPGQVTRQGLLAAGRNCA
jgi:DNA polymerase-3 subunit epsilon